MKKIFVHLKCALVIPAAVTASRQKFEVLKGIIASGICCFAAVTLDLNVFLTRIIKNSWTRCSMTTCLAYTYPRTTL